MSSKLYKELSDRRRSKRTGFILVPLIEELMRRPVPVNLDKPTLDFYEHLLTQRAKPRQTGILSPSNIANCERQQYFNMVGEKKQSILNLRQNGYFFDGEFRHQKWQYALFMLDRLHDEIWFPEDDRFELVGIEVPLQTKKKKWYKVRGTADGIVRVDDEFFVVDFKGMNSYAFGNFKDDPRSFQNYEMQICTYAILANHVFGREFKIDRALIIGERKDGPESGGSALGLHERVVQVSDHADAIEQRIARLKRYAAQERKPPIECKETTESQFYNCPFNKFCEREVRALS